MNKTIYFAQKGFIFDSTKTKVLVHKYSDAKYQKVKVAGKLGFPGGRIHFGEQPDDSLIREIEEETGITIKPSLPFYVWTWTYSKENEEAQIVAVARLGFYSSGEFHDAIDEPESTIEKSFWIDFDKINIDDFIEDERPIIRKFIEYKSRNPFILV